MCRNTGKKLELAKKLGAIEVVNIRKIDLNKAFKNERFHITIDTVGKRETVAGAIAYTMGKGRVLLFGFPQHNMVDINVFQAICKDLTIYVGTSAPWVWSRIPRLLSNKTIDVKPLVTNIFDFSRLQEAVETAINNRESVIKVVITNNFIK